jgi:hypothetical protein
VQAGGVVLFAMQLHRQCARSPNTDCSQRPCIGIGLRSGTPQREQAADVGIGQQAFPRPRA